MVKKASEEKEANKKEEKKVAKGESSSSSSKATITFLVILVVILALALLSVVFKTEINKLWHKIQGEGTNFTYHNMIFRKTFFGNLPMYETDLAIYRPVEDRTVGWTLKLRNDPRELDKNIAASIETKTERKIYISFSREPLECNGSMLAAYKLGEFFGALGITPKAAFATEDLAQENNYTYPVKNCSDAIGKWSIILLKQSDTNKSYIHQEGQCYLLEIANCETIETSERLFLALIDVMKHTPSESIESSNNETNTINTTNKSI